MELEVTKAFPTVIGQLRVPDAEAMNQDLQALILAEEASYLSVVVATSEAGTLGPIS